MKQFLIRAQVRDFNLAYAEAIMIVIVDEWFFRLNSFETEPRIMEFVGDGLLAISADKFADRIAQVVWAVNEGFCPVGVVFFDLESAPSTLCSRDHQAYERWLQSQTQQIGQLTNHTPEAVLVTEVVSRA